MQILLILAILEHFFFVFATKVCEQWWNKAAPLLYCLGELGADRSQMRQMQGHEKFYVNK